MKLSTKVRYGVRAMLDLALYQSGRPVLVKSIAEREDLSKKYLESLLAALKSAGLLRSVRGAKGGYPGAPRRGDHHGDDRGRAGRPPHAG